MQTPLQVIEQANQDAGITAPVFASLKEFNSFIDSFNELDYPANVIIPFQNNGTWLNGRRKGVIPLRGWILTPLQEDPNNYRTAKIESEYLAPMRKKAKAFIRSVIDSDLTDTEIESITDQIIPEYGFLQNVNRPLFGVQYILNWPVVESIC